MSQHCATVSPVDDEDALDPVLLRRDGVPKGIVHGHGGVLLEQFTMLGRRAAPPQQARAERL
ncbi:MAG: Acetoacetyl-CoA synthetase [uncultured Blastococcus sp.]|uniref:Acetoacetyl-CoA synthetase n=1 Tax=uncultured Blastococcus sp. TaxID=217144 RepID=A0A6J4HVQ3_9ACTN|nr:MAG: Acetoacetyl-CoA synthetase [uncultured Blastococcus sp.]